MRENTWSFDLHPGKEFDGHQTLREAFVPGGVSLDLASVPELEIREELGRGGMGIVLLAQQGRVRREVAVKRLLPDSTSEAQQRLVREAWVTGALEHPNIVPVHDVSLDASGRPQIVLKRIEGDSWQTLLDEPLRLPAEAEGDPVGAHLSILSTVCQAIEFAHRRGILH